MRAVRFLAGPFFIFAGAMHFAIPKTYRRIVPSYLPAPGAVVYASGMAEIVGGVGLVSRTWRRAAGWWLIATLIAVFPANVEMALGLSGDSRWRDGAVGAASASRGVHRLGA